MAAVCLALLAILLLVVVVQGWTAFGAAPQGERLARMEQSSQWSNGTFENPEPLWNDSLGMLTEALGSSDYSSPSAPLPVVQVQAERFGTPPSTGLRVTWLGHSTLLIEIDGHRFLTDPVWGERTSPLSWIGPKRWYAPPLSLADVPSVDAVIISHDHYDHLDQPTIAAIKDWDTTFIAPLGVGAHLAYWGVPEEHIVELDWWQSHAFGDLVLHATPARHASGRQVLDQDRTLWAGYAFVGPEHRVFFSGDTGLFPGMTEIGERLGPFEVAMIEVGAYGQAWPDWHLGPEQAVRAQQMLRGELLLPVHWGLFDLAYHGWTEPIERVLVAAQEAGTAVATPRPGESFEPAAPPAQLAWWPQVPWRSAVEYPIVATKVD
ncbi:MAG: MBL fold metallo-hydrolase [Nannocystaceae bacterium]